MKKLILSLIISYSLFNFNCHAQWQQTDCSYNNYFKSIIISESKIFAGTIDEGAFLSTNNGESWNAISTELSGAAFYTFAIKGDNIFGGTSSGIYLSTNNGQSWTAVNKGVTNSSINSITISEENIFAGSAGVFLSTNNGESWIERSNGLPNANYFITSIAISGTNIFIGTYGVGIFLSTDNGVNWIDKNNGLTTLYVNSLIISGENIYAGTGGGVFISTNKGASWIAKNKGLSPSDVSSLAISGTNIFAGTWEGGVALSTNNCESWNVVNNGLLYNPSITSLALNETYIFAGTLGAGIWKRSLSEMVGVNEFQVSGSKLQVECYPNLVGEITNIKYQISDKSQITIKVYDIMGKEVDEIDVSQAQHDKIKYDASKLRSGVYFVRLQSENGVRVAKFVKH